ncbi:hypothetical protein ACGFNY_44065 [Streptomyces chartreusis]|uniref:hypothetical protein n=1 Tax=Streptomyces chartreusis TaxID=1969 RepID=UPI00371165B2
MDLEDVPHQLSVWGHGSPVVPVQGGWEWLAGAHHLEAAPHVLLVFSACAVPDVDVAGAAYGGVEDVAGEVDAVRPVV